MRTAACLSVLTFLACAGSPTPITRYLLRADTPSSDLRVDGPMRVGLARVDVAPYLKQSGIMVQTEADQVRAARQHQWAEPLEAGLRALLRTEISHALGQPISADRADARNWDQVVSVYVDQLHGTMNGTAVLDALYRIDPKVGDTTEYRLSRSIPLPREGYSGIVDAQRILTQQLAQAIATAVRESQETAATP